MPEATTVDHFTTNVHYYWTGELATALLQEWQEQAEAERSAEENPLGSVIHFHLEGNPCKFEDHEIRNIGSTNVIHYTPEEDPPVEE